MRSTFVVAVLSAALALVACGDNRAASDAGPGGDVTPRRRPVVILMVGDGMGPGQIAAASLYAHGADGQLFLHTLPVSGQLNTASLSGTTDSCAAATTMATGARTLNYMCGVDRRGQAMETLVERAHALGLSAGVATTAAVVDATPAAFTAHRVSRAQKLEIAWDQTFVSKPDVILGGGVEYFLPAGEGSARSDEGLTPYLEADGYELVRTADELAGFRPGRGKKLAGFFGPGHLDYVLDRPTGSTQPTLRQLALAALAQLDTDPDGFFLMIEGARIDMACHANDAVTAALEMIEFDEAVAAAVEAAPDALIVVTADHATAGMAITEKAMERWKKAPQVKASAERIDTLIRPDTTKKGDPVALRAALQEHCGIADVTEEEATAYAAISGLYDPAARIGEIISRRVGVTFMPFEYRSLKPNITHGHDGAMVSVYARGPGATRFSGTMDNTEIPARIRELTGW